MNYTHLLGSWMKFRRESSKKDSQVISPGNTIDIHSCEQLRREIEIGIKRAKEIVINMAQVTYLDSAGVATLVLETKQARKSGVRLVLACTSDFLIQVLQLYRVADLECLSQDRSELALLGAERQGSRRNTRIVERSKLGVDPELTLSDVRVAG